MLKKYLPYQLLTALLLPSTVFAGLADSWSITQLGLTGSEYTRADGLYFSEAKLLNPNGYIAGQTSRFYGTNGSWGYVAWVYDGATSQKIGFYDSEHTSSEDIQLSGPTYMNESGMVAGWSVRYLGSSVRLGYTSWLFNGTETIRLGLSGREFIRADGYQWSGLNYLSNSGHATGSTSRFDGLDSRGQSAWFFNGVSNIQIGLTGADYTNAEGSTEITPSGMNENGVVIGSSRRYNGSAINGTDAWMHINDQTVRIGLTGSEYTGAGGQRASYARDINIHDEVVGNTSVYASSVVVGARAWLLKGANYTVIGLTDNEHVDGMGNSFNNANTISDNGSVLGSSTRFVKQYGLPKSDANFDPTDYQMVTGGISVWVYDGVETKKIGLTDVEHTSSNPDNYNDYDDFVDGYQDNFTREVNGSGQVIGGAYRYDGSKQNGVSAWFYDGVNTKRLGLTDAEHTTQFGRQVSNATHLNESGQVAGYSQFFPSNAGGTFEHAWLYDSNLDETFEFTLAGVDPSASFITSTIEYLGDDGLALGSYRVWGGSAGTIRGVFYFTVEEGWVDLEDFLLLSGLDIAQYGWQSLASAISSNSLGQIIGRGDRTDGLGESAYLLSPSKVPVPAAGWLFCSSLLVLFQVGRSGRAT